MKHSSSRELFAYWDEVRRGRLAPERSDIDPGAIRNALGDSFILALDEDEPKFRLAGTRVCALFCRELKGAPFMELWGAQSRADVDSLVRAGTDETAGSVAGAIGHVTDGQIDLELLLLPLSHRGKPHARLIGVLAPIKIPYWLGVEPVRELTLGIHRHVGPLVHALSGASRIKLPTEVPGRQRLVVYQGGRT